MDALEKQQLRNKMATQMGIFLEGTPSVECISSHYYDEPSQCELCGRSHAQELLVVKNRAGKKMRADLSCLKEMIRFQVTDVQELPRWLEKLKVLKKEVATRKEKEEQDRAEQRKKLERKVIVRKRT